MRERIRNYELMLIISPLHSTEEQIASILGRLQETIEANGGRITSVNQSSPWGRRKFAYPIRAYAGSAASRQDFTEGYYVLINVTVASVYVAEIERVIKLTDSILRHLMILTEDVPSSEFNMDADDENIGVDDDEEEEFDDSDTIDEDEDENSDDLSDTEEEEPDEDTAEAEATDENTPVR